MQILQPNFREPRDVVSQRYPSSIRLLDAGLQLLHSSSVILDHQVSLDD
jgi:hypothetical protein